MRGSVLTWISANAPNARVIGCDLENGILGIVTLEEFKDSVVICSDVLRHMKNPVSLPTVTRIYVPCRACNSRVQARALGEWVARERQDQLLIL
jgi:hypothetical protein